MNDFFCPLKHLFYFIFIIENTFAAVKQSTNQIECVNETTEI